MYNDYPKPDECHYPPGVREAALRAFCTMMDQAVAFYERNKDMYGPTAASTSSKRPRDAPHWPSFATISGDPDEYHFPHGAVQSPEVDGRFFFMGLPM